MNLQHVRKINGAVLPLINKHVALLPGGKKALLYRDKLVVNHVLTGKFVSLKIKQGA